MAVIESKGDGFSLVAGVKVPSSEVPEGEEAISLDGMNVIEWDGDTEGLETFPSNANLYLVSKATDADVAKKWITVRRSNLNKLVTVNAALSYNEQGYYTGLAYYVKDASEAYPTEGIYALLNKSYTTLLIAYYPIEEPEQPEEPEIDRGLLFLLYKIFSPDVFYAVTGKKHWSE